MARNRKNLSVAIRFGPVIKALLLCSLFVASGVGYVWQKSQIADLGQHLKTCKQALVKLESLNKKLRTDVAGLTSPDRLNQRLTEWNLGLAEPPQSQVWSLPEPAAPLPVRLTPAVKQYAARP